ncbi:MAG TPA: hypothetical protein VJ725_18345 [Thermoanaerobaculia bacterium]|nr:hypothetical protein [Thermoanaerobaculia bacterium]
MNGKKIFGIALLAAGVTASAAFAGSRSTDDLWLHVKVHDANEDSRVTINLPLSVIEKAGPMIPREARTSGRIRFGNDEDFTIDELREMWQEVQRKPDATFITVDERDSKVRVAKRGNTLHVFAVDKGVGKRDEEVEIKIPVPVINALLSGEGEQLNIGAAIQALARQGAGELVTVTGDDETVRIWVDDISEAR